MRPADKQSGAASVAPSTGDWQAIRQALLREALSGKEKMFIRNIDPIGEAIDNLSEKSVGWLVPELIPLPGVTLLYASLSFRAALPGWLLRWLLGPIVRRIVAQDARVLRLRTRNVERFGERALVSTEIDLLGPEVARLLSRGRASDDGPSAPVR